MPQSTELGRWIAGVCSGSRSIRDFEDFVREANPRLRAPDVSSALQESEQLLHESLNGRTAEARNNALRILATLGADTDGWDDLPKSERNAVFSPRVAESVTGLLSCHDRDTLEFALAAQKTIGFGLHEWRVVANLLESAGPECADTILRFGKALGTDARPLASSVAMVLARRHSSLAAVTLIELQPVPTQSILALLVSPDHEVRAMALMALSHPEATGALQAVLPLMDDPVAEVRVAACVALAAIGKARPSAVAALIRGLRDGSHVVRGSCVRSLAELGPEASTAVPALLDTLVNGSSENKVEAMAALGSIGPAASTALDALRRLEQDLDTRFAREAARAIACIHEQEYENYLNVLRDSSRSPAARARAAYALGIPGREGAVPALAQAIQEAPAVVACAAASSLGTIGRPALGLVEALRRLAADEERPVEVRDAASAAAARLWSMR